MKFETINDKLTVNDLLLIQCWETLGKVNIISNEKKEVIKESPVVVLHKPNLKLSAFWKRYNKLIVAGMSKKKARRLAKLNN